MLKRARRPASARDAVVPLSMSQLARRTVCNRVHWTEHSSKDKGESGVSARSASQPARTVDTKLCVCMPNPNCTGFTSLPLVSLLTSSCQGITSVNRVLSSTSVGDAETEAFQGSQYPYFGIFALSLTTDAGGETSQDHAFCLGYLEQHLAACCILADRYSCSRKDIAGSLTWIYVREAREVTF